MTSSIPLLVSFLSLLPTITALPITRHVPQSTLSKREYLSTSANFGIGFSIAFAFIFLVIAAYYFKVYRERRNTRFRGDQSAPQPAVSIRTRSPTIRSEKITVEDADQFKIMISCPLEMQSTALPQFSPAEPRAPPKFELDEKLAFDRPIIHELDASPRRPLSAHTVRKSTSIDKTNRKSRNRSLSGSKTHRRLTSAISVRTLRRSASNRKSHFHFGNRRSSIFDRSSWFCQGAMEIEDEMRRERGTSVDTLPAYPGPVLVRSSRSSSSASSERGLRDAKECLEGKSVCSDESGSISDQDGRKRVPTMDWSGMEWLKGVYAERKSKLRSFHPRDEKVEGDA